MFFIGVFRHMGGHFVTQACILEPGGWVFEHMGLHLGTRVVILAPERTFGHASRHFGAQVRV